MKALRLSLMVAVMLVVMGEGFAVADHNGHEFATAEECISSGAGFGQVPTCTSVDNGLWIARYGPMNEGAPGGAFAGLIAIALLWAAAPAVIGGIVASGRGQNVGLAIFLGIVLGWLGLLIVIFAFKQEVAAAARGLVESGARSSGVPQEPRRSPQGRLEELERLRRENLITSEEYASRRAVILEDI